MTDNMELQIWGRDFLLPVTFDCYKGETVTKEQIEAAEQFNVQQEMLNASKKLVEDFCKNDVAEDNENQKKDNIFSYIKPTGIFVKRDAQNPRVALMCNYRYDPEHGLAVVFSHDGKITVGSQDIIL